MSIKKITDNVRKLIENMTLSPEDQKRLNDALENIEKQVKSVSDKAKEAGESIKKDIASHTKESLKENNKKLEELKAEGYRKIEEAKNDALKALKDADVAAKQAVEKASEEAKKMLDECTKKK